MAAVPEEGLLWQGPVVWWQPVDGERHAFAPTRRPHPGEQRDTLCGRGVTLIDPTDVDWLMPTCDECMALAQERAERRRRGETPDHLHESFVRRMTGWTE